MFSFNPVAFAAIPVSLAYVTKAQEPRRALFYGAMFIFGLVLVHAALGIIAGLGGSGVQLLLGRYWGLLLASWSPRPSRRPTVPTPSLA